MYASKNENQINLVKTEFCFLKAISAQYTHERTPEA